MEMRMWETKGVEEVRESGEVEVIESGWGRWK